MIGPDNKASNPPVVVAWGLLGWSNKRPGLEVYRYDEKVIPRHGSEWGDLLVAEPDLADKEGAPVLVVVLPRRATKDDVIQATSAIFDAMERHARTTT